MLKHEEYGLLFAQIVVVLSLVSKTCKATKAKPIEIELADDHPIIRRPNRLDVSKKASVQTRCKELLAADLIELSHGEHPCTTVMPSCKDVFGNWT